MKKRIRIRRIMKWCGLVLNLLLIAAFFTSLKYSISLSCEGYALSSGYGCLFATEARTRAPLRFEARRLTRMEMFTKKPMSSSGRGMWYVVTPTWIPLLFAAIVTVWLWRSDRQPKSGCVECGYNLTGNVSGVCPECGSAIEPEPQVP